MGAALMAIVAEGNAAASTWRRHAQHVEGRCAWPPEDPEVDQPNAETTRAISGRV